MSKRVFKVYENTAALFWSLTSVQQCPLKKQKQDSKARTCGLKYFRTFTKCGLNAINYTSVNAALLLSGSTGSDRRVGGI